MSEFPGARVRNAQDLWRYLDEFEPGSMARVADRLDPETREMLEHSVRTAWIPIENDAKFVDAVLDELGVERSRELWRAYTSRFTQGGLVRALIDGSVRIFGLSLAGLVRVFPRAWQQSYRGCGGVQVEIQETRNAAIVSFADMHPDMVAREGYFVLLHGILLGLHDMVGVPDRMDLAIDRGDRSLTAILRW